MKAAGAGLRGSESRPEERACFQRLGGTARHPSPHEPCTLSQRAFTQRHSVQRSQRCCQPPLHPQGASGGTLRWGRVHLMRARHTAGAPHSLPEPQTPSQPGAEDIDSNHRPSEPQPGWAGKDSLTGKRLQAGERGATGTHWAPQGNRGRVRLRALRRERALMHGTGCRRTEEGKRGGTKRETQGQGGSRQLGRAAMVRAWGHSRAAAGRHDALTAPRPQP